MTRVFRRWSGTISRPITRRRMGILTAVLGLSSPRQIRSRCSGGWRTRTFQAWIAWSRASLSGLTASQWRSGLRPRTLSMSTRSRSLNGCFIATGMSTCFRRPTTTLRELRNPETVKASHDRCREAQRAKKRGDPAPGEETTGKGSARPAEPENPPSGKGKRPAEPADPPKGKGRGKGKYPGPDEEPKGQGRWVYWPEKGEAPKGKKGDTEKGKSKTGSSKGSTEKGKSKGKHYSKGKGQK